MSPWPFVTAAYAITLAAAAVLVLVRYIAMKRAEK